MRREGTCPSLGSCPQCHTTCATQNQKKVMTGSPPRPCTTRYLGSKLSAFTCLHVTCYIRMFGGRLRRTGGRTANPEPRNPKYSPSPFFVQKTLLTHTRHRRGALLGTLLLAIRSAPCGPDRPGPPKLGMVLFYPMPILRFWAAWKCPQHGVLRGYDPWWRNIPSTTAQGAHNRQNEGGAEMYAEQRAVKVPLE